MKSSRLETESSSEYLRLLREFGLDLAALLWPTSCFVCGAADRDCCESCRAELQADVAGVIETTLQTNLPRKLQMEFKSQLQLQMQSKAHPELRVCAAGLYEDPMKSLLLALKHDGVTGFTKLLADRLITPLHTLTKGLEGKVFLIGAPSRAARVRERGYRHVELLIRAALRKYAQLSAHSLILPGPQHQRPQLHQPQEAQYKPPQPQLTLLPRALRAASGRSTQVGLSSELRRKNAERMSVSRRVRPLLTGAQVVLVDDVVTTGATITACAKALREADARVVGVVTLCLVKRRDDAYLKTS